MPAVTLGLAEIEERLQVLRRRLNTVTLLHAAFLSLSTLFLVAAALVAVGLRGDVSSFRAATWSGAVLVAGVVGGSAMVTRRRWLDAPATAELADQRGQLTDRLTTLIDLRRRPRPSRLAPVLIAQALALGERWRPQRIIPRRVPRSLFLVLLSLIALIAAPLAAPAPPPAPPVQLSKHQKESVSSTRDGAAPAGSLIGNGAAGDSTGEGTLDQAGEVPAPQALGDSSAQTPPLPAAPVPDTTSAILPDRLRNALLSALQAEPMDHGHELGKDAAGHAKDRTLSTADDRAGAPPDGAAARRPAEGGESASQHETGAHRQEQPDDAKAGDHTQHAKSDAGGQSQSGSAPNAGTGSRPENLLGAVAAESGPGGATTFKLTITSFLRAVETKQPPQTGKQGGSGAAAPDAGAPAPALNEQQLRDDALRKAEIPPEYEDIVRRVYSARDGADGSH